MEPSSSFSLPPSFSSSQPVPSPASTAPLPFPFPIPHHLLRHLSSIAAILSPSTPSTEFLVLLTYFIIISGLVYGIIVEPPEIGSTQDRSTSTVRPVVFLPGCHLTMNSSSPANIKIFVDGIEVTRPNLFNTGWIMIHGLQGFVSPLSLLSCGQDYIPYPKSYSLLKLAGLQNVHGFPFSSLFPPRSLLPISPPPLLRCFPATFLHRLPYWIWISVARSPSHHLPARPQVFGVEG